MKKTKKSQVEAYLNELMEKDSFTIDDLLELTIEKLMEAPQMKGIGKITVSTVLANFKSKYGDDFFNEIDKKVLEESGESIVLNKSDLEKGGVLSQDEIRLLKIMIQEQAGKQNAELIELKLALKNAGIDYVMILKDYRSQKELELKEWENTGSY